MKNLQRVYRVLGNKRRFAIVQLLLKRKELSVGAIAGNIELSMTATSQHLNALANADVLEKRQQGLTMYYRIVDSPTPSVAAALRPMRERS
jgi:DNA-binding transcriptional ArsR family regulator